MTWDLVSKLGVSVLSLLRLDMGRCEFARRFLADILALILRSMFGRVHKETLPSVCHGEPVWRVLGGKHASNECEGDEPSLLGFRMNPGCEKLQEENNA